MHYVRPSSKSTNGYDDIVVYGECVVRCVGREGMACVGSNSEAKTLPTLSTISTVHTERGSSEGVSNAFTAAHLQDVQQRGTIESPFVLMARNMYSWIEWIIIENRAVTMCEKILAKQYTRLNKTTAKTLKAYMKLLENSVKDEITHVLKDKKIGVVFDCWTKGGFHFVCFLAVTAGRSKDDGHGVRSTFMLSFEAFESGNFGANAMIDILDNTLDQYQLDPSQLVFLVGDNASVNVALAKRVKVPLVGCASHRLHLAAEVHIDSQRDVVDERIGLMRLLRTAKRRTELRSLCMAPQLRNATRWSSTVAMITSYFDVEGHLDETDHELALHMPSTEEKIRLRQLHSDLMDFDSVGKKTSTSGWRHAR